MYRIYIVNNTHPTRLDACEIPHGSHRTRIIVTNISKHAKKPSYRASAGIKKYGLKSL